VRLDIALPGHGHLLNALAATAVGLELGIDLGAITARLALLAPGHHRGAVLRTPSGVTLLDDTYNSSPAALLRSFDVLAARRPAGRRIAVLGEMLELGDESVALHEACGRAAAHAGVERIVTIGGDPARRLGEAAVSAGLPRRAATHVATSADAAEVAAAEVLPGDLVLVKGSRGIRAEAVVTRLMAGGG
jgi:UDP-N-acetylmuramoyl-tripeptide--D-alanyl-D-alanine ligase